MTGKDVYFPDHDPCLRQCVYTEKYQAMPKGTHRSQL